MPTDPILPQPYFDDKVTTIHVVITKNDQIPSSRIFIPIFGQQEIRQLNIRLEHTFTYTKENHAL